MFCSVFIVTLTINLNQIQSLYSTGDSAQTGFLHVIMSSSHLWNVVVSTGACLVTSHNNAGRRHISDIVLSTAWDASEINKQISLHTMMIAVKRISSLFSFSATTAIYGWYQILGEQIDYRTVGAAPSLEDITSKYSIHSITKNHNQ